MRARAYSTAKRAGWAISVRLSVPASVVPGPGMGPAEQDGQVGGRAAPTGDQAGQVDAVERPAQQLKAFVQGRAERGFAPVDLGDHARVLLADAREQERRPAALHGVDPGEQRRHR